MIKKFLQRFRRKDPTPWVHTNVADGSKYIIPDEFIRLPKVREVHRKMKEYFGRQK